MTNEEAEHLAQYTSLDEEEASRAQRLLELMKAA